MNIKIFLSTDGKHTVQVDADLPEADEAYVKAEELYTKIIDKHGTKQEQAVKAYAKKESFPNDEPGGPAKPASVGIPMCPDHHKPMAHGKYGWYCKTPIGTDPATDKTIWCKAKPPVEFARE